jgi:hypothetical protein
MNRILTVLGALAVWAVSSVFLFGICALSVNPAVISAATFVIFACLMGLVVTLSTGRDDSWVFAFAAGPAYVAGGVFGLAIIFNLALILFA